MHSFRRASFDEPHNLREDNLFHFHHQNISIGRASHHNIFPSIRQAPYSTGLAQGLCSILAAQVECLLRARADHRPLMTFHSVLVCIVTTAVILASHAIRLLL